MFKPTSVQGGFKGLGFSGSGSRASSDLYDLEVKWTPENGSCYRFRGLKSGGRSE